MQSLRERRRWFLAPVGPPGPLLVLTPAPEYKTGYYSSLSSLSGALQAGGMEERQRGVNYNGGWFTADPERT